jgi:hypothetical protein
MKPPDRPLHVVRENEIDPDAPPSEEELRAADQLRASLEKGDLPELAEAVRASAHPARLSGERHRAILDRALAAKPAKSNVRYVAFGVASLAAMAASLVLVMRQSEQLAPSASREASAPLAVSRSTAELFPEGIPLTGGTSDRVDRIAYARAQDLRENRFAQWGVR